MAEISFMFAIDAEELLGAGKFAEAAELCRLGIETYPDYPAAYSILAQSYLELNKLEDSLDALSRGFELFPNNKALITIKDRIANIVYEKQKASFEIDDSAITEKKPSDTITDSEDIFLDYMKAFDSSDSDAVPDGKFDNIVAEKEIKSKENQYPDKIKNIAIDDLFDDDIESLEIPADETNEDYEQIPDLSDQNIMLTPEDIFADDELAEEYQPDSVEDDEENILSPEDIFAEDELADEYEPEITDKKSNDMLNLEDIFGEELVASEYIPDIKHSKINNIDSFNPEDIFGEEEITSEPADDIAEIDDDNSINQSLEEIFGDDDDININLLSDTGKSSYFIMFQTLTKAYFDSGDFENAFKSLKSVINNFPDLDELNYIKNEIIKYTVYSIPDILFINFFEIDAENAFAEKPKAGNVWSNWNYDDIEEVSEIVNEADEEYIEDIKELQEESEVIDEYTVDNEYDLIVNNKQKEAFSKDSELSGFTIDVNADGAETFLILAKSYRSLNDVDTAFKTIEIAVNLFPYSEKINDYKTKLIIDKELLAEGKPIELFTPPELSNESMKIDIEEISKSIEDIFGIDDDVNEIIEDISDNINITSESIEDIFGIDDDEEILKYNELNDIDITSESIDDLSKEVITQSEPVSNQSKMVSNQSKMVSNQSKPFDEELIEYDLDEISCDEAAKEYELVEISSDEEIIDYNYQENQFDEDIEFIDDDNVESDELENESNTDYGGKLSDPDDYDITEILDYEDYIDELSANDLSLIPGLIFDEDNNDSDNMEIMPEPPPFDISQYLIEIKYDEIDNDNDEFEYDVFRELSDKLSNAKIPVIIEEEALESFPEEDEPTIIVSETMAKIYESQGYIDIAIKVYEELASQNPFKSLYYMERANKLRINN